MSLWLARHAQPLVAPGICYGATDMAADAQLTLQAARALALELPLGIAVRVSPLRRCQQLAEALQAERHDLHFTTDMRLREMDFGLWEGVAWTDIPRAAIDAWTADFAQHRFGGQESANEVLERVASAWDALHALHDTLWIAHSGIAQAATLLHQGMRHISRAEDWPLSKLPYGGWVRF
ncbi:phosphoglycerate kinase [Rhodoferax lacus]|uniref:Phosphoglycerate kinase n=1 Tax=Rhodoferax lacus TaxID=2184758 RepID=A0A3E1RH76_9BURK|nr:histidine phosphatase family protein [Rhodoferax lacus]RFO98708.1 phosphoglycerate kinase [Rhodoferax lacus]